MKHIVIGEAPPTLAALAFLMAYERADVEAAIETLIERLDRRDGDPDMEPAGDELDGCGAEDEAGHRWGDDGPGCPVADAGEPMLAMPEECGSRWGGSLVAGDTHHDDEDDDIASRRRHRDRIRRDRCEPYTWQGLPAYQLMPEQPRERDILRLRWPS